MKEEKECVCERDLQGSVSSKRDFTHRLERKTRPVRAKWYEELQNECIQLVYTCDCIQSIEMKPD